MKLKVWSELLPAMPCRVWCFGRVDEHGRVEELGTRTCWADAYDAACLVLLKAELVEEVRQATWVPPELVKAA